MIFDVGPLPPVGVGCRGRRIVQNPLKNKHFERFGRPRGRRIVQNPLKNKHFERFGRPRGRRIVQNPLKNNHFEGFGRPNLYKTNVFFIFRPRQCGPYHGGVVWGIDRDREV